MTSRERMRTLLSGSRPDRVPCIPLIVGYAAKIAGFSLKDIYYDPEKSYKAQILAADLHGYDGSPSYASASFGGWEFGGEIKYPEEERFQTPVIIKYPVKTSEDVEKLEIPDSKTAGSIPNSIAFAKISRQHGGSISFQAGTPFTVAGNVIGHERMLYWMIKEPELVHNVLRKVTEFLISVAKYFVDGFGAERCMALDYAPLESNQLISPQQFETFSFPYTLEIHERVLAMGVRSFFSHLCGDHNKNLKLWKEIPFGKPGIISIGTQIDLGDAKEMFGEKHIIAGNVSTGAILQESPEEVMELCRQCIEKGKDSPRGYILMAGCEVPPLSPPVNVHAMVKAAKEYGRY